MSKVFEDMIRETRENVTVEHIRNLMDTTKMSAQQAMDALNIPPDEQRRYLSKLAKIAAVQNEQGAGS